MQSVMLKDHFLLNPCIIYNMLQQILICVYFEEKKEQFNFILPHRKIFYSFADDVIIIKWTLKIKTHLNLASQLGWVSVLCEYSIYSPKVLNVLSIHMMTPAFYGSIPTSLPWQLSYLWARKLTLRVENCLILL